ncbi:hypothetical protein J3R82DRAFT_9774 [Butyriboletus roseoflavus]|nr:hypothetical protein J3R82DRAFT_9774 [Butyriboletus roseoflavus]
MATPPSHATRPGKSSGVSKLLNDYVSALNWATGETVAVKEIQLSNIPKGELGQIMSEIDLLKNLNHPNIVKYKGFVKTREYLYIILEFCENGSLHNICKRFGKFPENLVAVYIRQVLEGLVYLHDQGVIHRDIKGANILTNKDGCVKLADFGVASSTTTGAVSDDAVVGSPYWMAPEVIEQSGATTASDIWSVGCVVIELLEGKPPYHFLDPMPALFRIVQDDCPPIPEGASPIVKDFLLHCFQKDSNLRISAKKLLRHPWMVAAKKQMDLSAGKDGHPGSNNSQTSSGAQKRPSSNYNYDEAVLKVQEWNEALKSPTRPSKHGSRTGVSDGPPPSPTRPLHNKASVNLFQHSVLGLQQSISAPMAPKAPPPTPGKTSAPVGLVEKIREPLAFVLQQPEEQTDNWDDDFEDGPSFSKLQALEKSAMEDDKPEVDDNAQTIRPNRSPAGPGTIPLARAPAADIVPIVEDYSDLASEEDDIILQEKVADFKPFTQALASFTGSCGLEWSTTWFTSLAFTSVSLLLALVRVVRDPLDDRKPSESQARMNSINMLKWMTRTMMTYLAKSTALVRFFFRPVVFEHLRLSVETALEQPMQTLQLNTRHSNKSWLGDEDDEDDPFAEIDEGFAEDDLETNLQRDKHARLCSMVNQLIDELTPSAPDFQLRDACDQLITIMTENPEMLFQLVSSHGMLGILEVLEGKCSRDVLMKLLHIINLLVTSDLGVLESFCLIGGIPVMMGFTSKKYPSECRTEASNFIRLLCHTSALTLQMFISCRGLKVLVDLLDEDYTEQSELVVDALNGIGSVFELQSPTTKNDFCRMFIREGLLDPLSSALLNVMGNQSETAVEMKHKIIQILLVFSQVTQSDIHVRNAMGTRKIIRRLMRACELLEGDCLVQMLKAVKHLSMNANLLEVLQNANAIEILVKLLDEDRAGPHGTEVSNHIFQTCYNLCRLNKLRQEEAAQAGIIPCLKRVIETSSPLKQFALPILCDLASAGKSCRNLLWQHNGLSLYLKLLEDPYFQVSALEAILSWLQDETAKIEDQLVKSESLDALLKCFVSAKANSFENLLDPLLKICRISNPLTIGLAKASLFKRIIDRLSHSRAVVRLNLLRILRTICDVHPNRAILVERYGLHEIVTKLSKEDGAVLVRELAREILPALAPALKPAPGKPGSKGPDTPKNSSIIAPKKARRTASETSALLSSSYTPLGPGVGATTRLGIERSHSSRHRLGDIAWQPGGASIRR